MEDIHNFQGGLHTDFDAQNQPPNTYREAYNWIRLEDGSLVVEKGTRIVSSFPVENTVVGLHPLGEEVIVFSWSLDTDNLPYGEIGLIDNSNNYTICTSHSSFAFQNKSIKAEARLDYRGHKLVYFWDINGELPVRRVDLNETYSGLTIDESTKLFLNSTLPIIDEINVSEDGSLPTGIYQFSTRLLTSSLNKTASSLITNIVPITNESVSGGVEQYDGALPQTPSFKAINLSISNIDTKYKFIEIIATTYEGLTNTVKSNVIATKLITGATMNHRYTSLEENGEEVLLDELTIEPVVYDYPKAGTQKDGHLLLANLEAKRYDYNFQSVANRAIISYVIKELDYTEDININGSYNSTNTSGGKDIGTSTSEYDNYKTETYTTDFRGYQRDEVYSFALVPMFKNGTYGNAYHIPGNYSIFTGDNPGDIGSNPANTTTKRLGYYKCKDEVYPENFGYPIGNVCYHQMPTMHQESIWDGTKIRVLGIKVEYDLTLLSSEERDNIVGIAIVRELRTEANKSILAQGIVNPLTKRGLNIRTVSPFAGKSNHDYSIAPADRDYFYNSVAFYSPETTIFKNNMTVATSIVPLGNMSGYSKLVADKTTGANIEEEFAHFFLNYNGFTTFTPEDTNHIPSVIKKNTITYINHGTSYNVPGLSYSINTESSNGFLFFETETDVKVFNNYSTLDRIDGYGEITYEYHNAGASDIRVHSGGSVVSSQTGETNRNLFNIVSAKDNQYGSVLDKEYVLVNYKLLNEDSFIECYGGDTFINKTSIVSATEAPINNNGASISFKTLSYFFCESSINTAYRHYTIENGITVNVPYYPKSRNFYTDLGDGILNYDNAYGHATAYNKQYSFENTLKKFYSKSQFTEEEVTRFENRAIYSEQSVEGEQFDAYRLFLPNNYHDIPKNKGVISNIFIHQNDLYIHTSQSLWKSSFNERVTQISSAGEVVLGNGGAFSRPSIEMFPHAGGYAGSIDSLATISTPYGTFFIDRLQGKIFLLGSSFEEVSNGIRKDLRDMLNYANTSIAGFDYLNDRLLIGVGNDTLSYYPKLKSFTSYHSYAIGCITSVNQKTFVSLGTLEELNQGNYNFFFGGEEDYYFGFVSNPNPLATKTFDSIVINSNTVLNNLEVSDELKSITKELVENDEWEFEPTEYQSRITKQNNEYRVSIPLDEDDRRIKGKYSYIKFTKNNSNPQEVIVKYITVKYRINAR
jgi:hypothetical protein